MYVSIRQHTSAYGSIRQHTSAYVSIRQHTKESRSARTEADGRDTNSTCRCFNSGCALADTY
jgi:hypothetical protein